MQDSTRYSTVLRERETAEAKRDTVLRSLNMIRAIDDDRYIWPHVMDEVSNALPPYTWIVALGFSGGGQATAPIRTVMPAANDKSTGRKHKVPTRDREGHGEGAPRRQHGRHPGAHAIHEAARDLRLPRKRAARQLAARDDNGKEVTQFQLDMRYTRPGADDVRRVPLAVSVR